MKTTAVKANNNFDEAYFNQRGLNMQAVFNLSDLPQDVLQSLGGSESLLLYRQLILIAHGGRDMWRCLQASGMKTENPVDDFSVSTVNSFFTQNFPNSKYELRYPDDRPIGLQRLGDLAGWHHASPMKVGINSQWGSWYAYRAVVLADTHFTETKKMKSGSPCDTCLSKDCVKSCPAGALANSEFSLNTCVEYRKRIDSVCRNQCVARIRCPVAVEHRYTEEQIHYHYSVSMKTIEQYY
ncbi:MAG: hypothetical protein OEM38_00120 [Gammaproteobacteria bacterium]|nr:hypothetical protein [Gammaproteobacteria bacterium]